MSAVPNDLVELGRIVSAYGVRGWVKVQPHAAGGDTLRAVKQWWLKAPEPNSKKVGVFSSAVPFAVDESRLHSGTVVALFDGFNDRDQAERLKAHTVWVSRASFPATDTEEYYWVDLIGCMLYGELNDQPALLGRVAGVLDNGAHAVLDVECGTLTPEGDFKVALTAQGKGIRVMVPFVEAHVHTVDIKRQRLESNWPVDF
ncbi:ribosome maturation factor RimM [Paenalcaligenes niemegkensis]|uniref:ribosome maturation factor RimM n=1 Tax=Paenalcaligenes niemegkensis TaxID=2895469 RepID=UPI001EE918B3|nr:ribosome maturation factor RimM [Paenalcaligenes niemegkensis]MCQ9616734.1 ribosome maturation factor RimM [Paenalcaligenes niemegkensis]